MKHLLIVILFAFNIYGQSTKLDSVVINGIDNIYSLKFNTAYNTFDKLELEIPQSPIPPFFKAMITWWKILLDLPNTSYDEKFYNQLDSVIIKCDSILDKEPENPEALFFKGGAIGFKGRLKSIRKEWFDAAIAGKKALSIVFRVNELDSANIDVKFGLGIYNYYAAAIPEKYPAVKPLMILIPEGNKTRGIKYLEEAALNGKFSQYEAAYFLMTLYYGFEDNYSEALRWAEVLKEKFPSNPVFEKYYGRLKIKTEGYLKASKYFEEIYKKCKERKYGYNLRLKREAAYYIGMKHRLKKEWIKSLNYFLQCLSISQRIDKEENGFWSNSALYVGNAYDKLNQRNKALKYYKMVLELNDFNNNHQLAKKFIEKKFE